MRVNMSAIGSVMLMRFFLYLPYPETRRISCESYQLALRTPGIIPDSASSRKQIRHRPKRRRYARDRPHRLHRFFLREENFGFSFDFSMSDFGGIDYFLFPSSVVLNGIPIAFRSASA